MAKTLISTPLDITTADTSEATVDITSGIDSTYPVYEFHFVNLHPATNNVNFTFQVNAHDGTSQLTGFNETITSSAFRSYLKEDGTGGAIGYDSNSDQSQGNAYQRILSTGTGSDNDQCVSGVLTLYAPSSTVYVKHFASVGNGTDHGDWSVMMNAAGYINTTNAITQISFKFDSGDIQAGTIKMFGVS